jgi:hypothetical protein
LGSRPIRTRQEQADERSEDGDGQRDLTVEQAGVGFDRNISVWVARG